MSTVYLKKTYDLNRHERACTGGVHRVYPGGVYHSTPSVFERLDNENIRVPESLRYYPYRTTFDFEYWFDTARLPSYNDKMQWVAHHVPLSVSVASNVPGHEQVQCLVTDGYTNNLVSAMMGILQSMNDDAYENKGRASSTGKSTIELGRNNDEESRQPVQNADETTL